VGAALVRANNTIAETGYNGFRPGHSDDPALYADREYKLANVIHAERNAIDRSSYADKVGASLYVSFPCCSACVTHAIDNHITRLICLDIDPTGKTQEWVDGWEAQKQLSLKLADEAGVQMVIVPRALLLSSDPGALVPLIQR
jgi:dCMP deaminase